MTDIQVKTFGYSFDKQDNFKSVDLYFSNDANDQTPLIVFVHGGAWRSEDKSDYKQLCTDFVNVGYTVASANYRLSLKENDQTQPSVQHPDHIHDMAECIEFLAEPPIVGKYKTAGGFYLVGHSAGGHIISMLLLDSPVHTLIRGVLSVSGIYDIPLLLNTFPSYLDFISGGFGKKTDYRDDSPVNKTSSQLGNKPIILAQSPQDTLIDNAQSEVMYSHLKKFHSNVTLDLDISGDHYEIMNFKTLHRLVVSLIQ